MNLLNSLILEGNIHLFDGEFYIHSERTFRIKNEFETKSITYKVIFEESHLLRFREISLGIENGSAIKGCRVVGLLYDNSIIKCEHIETRSGTPMILKTKPYFTIQKKIFDI
jgi:hypothetical protein